MVAKLPKWAQDRMKALERERDTAVRALNAHVDGQTPSKVYWEEYLSTGEGHGDSTTGPTNKRFYVQTDRLVVENCGIRLAINCHGSRDLMHWPGIQLRWSDPFDTQNMVALVPDSFQSAFLIANHNMRVRPVTTETRACKHQFSPAKFCLTCGWRKML